MTNWPDKCGSSEVIRKLVMSRLDMYYHTFSTSCLTKCAFYYFSTLLIFFCICCITRSYQVSLTSYCNNGDDAYSEQMFIYLFVYLFTMRIEIEAFLENTQTLSSVFFFPLSRRSQWKSTYTHRFSFKGHSAFAACASNLVINSRAGSVRVFHEWKWQCSALCGEKSTQGPPRSTGRTPKRLLGCIRLYLDGNVMDVDHLRTL